jgi:hypothetical protein
MSNGRHSMAAMRCRQLVEVLSRTEDIFRDLCSSMATPLGKAAVPLRRKAETHRAAAIEV